MRPCLPTQGGERDCKRSHTRKHLHTYSRRLNVPVHLTLASPQCQLQPSNAPSVLRDDTDHNTGLVSVGLRRGRLSQMLPPSAFPIHSRLSTPTFRC